jgi:thioredoxin reductase (NADPH)
MPQSDNAPVEKMIILGAGPAGLSAALYAARADLKPLLFTGMEPGGQAAKTSVIENYPGFPEGINGSRLGDLFQQQAEKFGARIEFDEITSVDFTHSPFKVTTYNGVFLAESIVIATGAGSNHLGVPGEKELTGMGVSYCATCDGWFFKEKKVVVVGGGDSAIEEALFLTRYASSVTIVHRRDSLRAGSLLQKRAHDNPRISFIWNSVVTGILGTQALKALQLRNLVTGHESELSTDGLFIFIGHTPNTALFKDQIALDEHDYIKVDMLMQTSVPGVFAAGEVADPHYRQVITSAGMGAAAAIQATRFLDQ